MAKETNTEFVNPFAPGVSYPQFIEAVEKSGKTVKEYLTGNILNEATETIADPKEKADRIAAEISWIEGEIRSYKEHLKNKDANLKKANAEHLILSNPNMSDEAKKQLLKNL